MEIVLWTWLPVNWLEDLTASKYGVITYNMHKKVKFQMSIFERKLHEFAFLQNLKTSLTYT